VLEGELSIVGFSSVGSPPVLIVTHPLASASIALEPPAHPDHVSAFMNVRVADIQSVYKDWTSRGAHFLTPPSMAASKSAATCATPTAT
jgi:hypothetical protein